MIKKYKQYLEHRGSTDYSPNSKGIIKNDVQTGLGEKIVKTNKVNIQILKKNIFAQQENLNRYNNILTELKKETDEETVQAYIKRIENIIYMYYKEIDKLNKEIKNVFKAIGWESNEIILKKEKIKNIENKININKEKIKNIDIKEINKEKYDNIRKVENDISTCEHEIQLYIRALDKTS